jgi:CRP-like cAMP-binding protein
MADKGTQPGLQATLQQALRPRPLAELLDCPAEVSNLLNVAAQFLAVQSGQAVFRQDAACQGLYVLVTGRYLRRATRLGARFMLGPARAGDVVELAAALGEGAHTYTLTAQTDGSMLLLPRAPLHRALESHPPLRMRLLEELAREVSRGYLASCQDHAPKGRRRNPGAATD